MRVRTGVMLSCAFGLVSFWDGFVLLILVLFFCIVYLPMSNALVMNHSTGRGGGATLMSREHVPQEFLYDFRAISKG